jgi:hypothetical protein
VDPPLLQAERSPMVFTFCRPTHQWPVRESPIALPASTSQHTHPERGRIVGDLLGETSLPDARLTAQQEQVSAAGRCVVQTGTKFLQFTFSPDKRMELGLLGRAFLSHSRGPRLQLAPIVREVPTGVARV